MKSKVCVDFSTYSGNSFENISYIDRLTFTTWFNERKNNNNWLFIFVLYLYTILSTYLHMSQSENQALIQFICITIDHVHCKY